MNRLQAAFVLASAFILWSCTTSPKVVADLNPAVDITTYQTFAWVNDRHMISGPPGMNPITKQKIDREFEAQLAALGYRQVSTPDQADFAIAYTVGARDKIRADSYPSDFRVYQGWGRGYYGFYGPGPNYETRITSYTQGRLALDVFDVKSGQPAWHAFAEKRITDKIQKEPGPAIQEIVGAIVGQFPPAN